MRVAFATTSYPSAADDARGIHVHRLAVALKKRGLDISVLTLSDRTQTYDLDGITVNPIGKRVAGPGHLVSGISGIVPNLRRRPWLVRELPWLMQDLKDGLSDLSGFDLVHSHWLFPTSSLLVDCGLNVPLVSTAHGGDVNLISRIPGLRQRVRRAASRSDVVIAVSDGIADALVGLGVDPDSITSLPVGVPLRGESDRSHSGPLRVLFVGGLSKRKSVRTLIDAFVGLDRTDAGILRIAGDGPEAGALHRRVRARGLQAVSFLGVVPPDQLQAQMEWADVLVLPSTSEGKPTVIMEAFASGLPVLATDIPGSRELVTHGENGYLFPVGDSTRLQDQLMSLVSDRQQLAHLAVGSRNSAAAYSIDLVAEQHEGLYNQLLAKSGSGS